MCLSAVPAPAPAKPIAPPSPRFNYSRPLQVWAGPLVGGDVAVLLLNSGDTNATTIVASWAELGLANGATVTATNLWTGKEHSEYLTSDGVIAKVDSHDVAAIRLTAKTEGSTLL